MKVRKALCQVANEVRAGTIPPAVGSSIANILRVIFLGENDEVWAMIRTLKLERESGHGGHG